MVVYSGRATKDVTRIDVRWPAYFCQLEDGTVTGHANVHETEFLVSIWKEVAAQGHGVFTGRKALFKQVLGLQPSHTTSIDADLISAPGKGRTGVVVHRCTHTYQPRLTSPRLKDSLSASRRIPIDDVDSIVAAGNWALHDIDSVLRTLEDGD